MGISDNFKKLQEFGKLKTREKRVEQEITKALIEDTNFSREYSSFVKGLREKLDQALLPEEEEGFGYLEITIRPLPNKRSYFLNFMQDEQYSTYYKIEETAGKEFKFRLISTLDS